MLLKEYYQLQRKTTLNFLNQIDDLMDKGQYKEVKLGLEWLHCLY